MPGKMPLPDGSVLLQWIPRAAWHQWDGQGLVAPQDRFMLQGPGPVPSVPATLALLHPTPWAAHP